MSGAVAVQGWESGLCASGGCNPQLCVRVHAVRLSEGALLERNVMQSPIERFQSLANLGALKNNIVPARTHGNGMQYKCS